MNKQKKENLDALAGNVEVKMAIEAAKLQDEICQIRQIRATHFWDRHANCIVPIPNIRGALA